MPQFREMIGSFQEWGELGRAGTLVGAYWLIVESPQNWEVDRGNDFGSFGVHERYKKAIGEMSTGDLLVTYVTKVSAFADVREIASVGAKPISGDGAYDRKFDLEVATRPLTVLSPDSWVRASSLHDQLEITRGKRRPGLVFMTSVRRLPDEDGARIVEAIERAVANEQKSGE